MVLDEADRSVTNDNRDKCEDDDGNWICVYDREASRYTSAQWKGEGYYRLLLPAGKQIPEYAPVDWRCGSALTGWLNGTHPDQFGVEVNMTVCFDWDRGNKWDCRFKRDIRVTNCKGYYVYFLPELTFQSARYCGAIP